MPVAIKRENNSDTEPINMDDIQMDAKNIVDKIIKDVGKASATKQLVIGCASGWFSGYLMMKVGKAAAVALGGGIILLQVANHNGYIKVNWDKLAKKADEVGDKVEATASSKAPKLLDKRVNSKLQKIRRQPDIHLEEDLDWCSTWKKGETEMRGKRFNKSKENGKEGEQLEREREQVGT